MSPRRGAAPCWRRAGARADEGAEAHRAGAVVHNEVAVALAGAGEVGHLGPRDALGAALHVDDVRFVALEHGRVARGVPRRRHEDRLARGRVVDLDPRVVERGVAAVRDQVGVVAPLLHLLRAEVRRRVDDRHAVLHPLAVRDQALLHGDDAIHVDQVVPIDRHQVRERDHRDVIEHLEAVDALAARDVALEVRGRERHDRLAALGEGVTAGVRQPVGDADPAWRQVLDRDEHRAARVGVDHGLDVAVVAAAQREVLEHLGRLTGGADGDAEASGVVAVAAPGGSLLALGRLGRGRGLVGELDAELVVLAARQLRGEAQRLLRGAPSRQRDLRGRALGVAADADHVAVAAAVHEEAVDGQRRVAGADKSAERVLVLRPVRDADGLADGPLLGEPDEGRDGGADPFDRAAAARDLLNVHTRCLVADHGASLSGARSAVVRSLLLAAVARGRRHARARRPRSAR